MIFFRKSPDFPRFFQIFAPLFGLLLLVGCTGETESSGFAGLAESQQTDTDVSFLQPGPGDRLRFPEDFGPHPQHRIEWWYLTANLENQAGEPLGLQWTQFRQALTPRPVNATPPASAQWPLQAAWMAHGALSWRGQHHFAERLARADVGHAGATAQPFEVWLDDWRLSPTSESGRWRLQVSADNWSYDLFLRLNGPPVAHGDRGFSAKSASGKGSMYFSLVDISIAGKVTIDGETQKVRGKGWFDREWSSQLLKTGQQGWDWFALHLDTGNKLMAFQLREDGGVFSSGTWINGEGGAVSLSADDLILTPDPDAETTPTRWRLQVPRFDVDLDIAAPPGNYRNKGQFPYWESPVSVSGSHSGEGYMELTGYEAE